MVVSVKNRKNGIEGVSLIALCITIMVIVILVGIGIYGSTNMIKEVKLEELKTNMLLIQAKARECVKDASFQMGMNPDDVKKDSVRNEIYREKAKLQKATEHEIPSNFGITDMTNCYWLTTEAQTSWGLSKLQLKNKERYLIQFNETDETVEIYNTVGYHGQYSLTAIEQIEE